MRLFLLFIFSLTVLLSQSPSESRLHLERAVSLESQGQIDQAASAFKLAIEQANAAELPHALDLACNFYHDTGQVSHAESCLRRLYSVFEKKLGKDHLTLNRVINRLACLYIEMDQRGKVERLHIEKWLTRLEAEAPLSDDYVDLAGTLAALEVMRKNPRRAAELNARNYEILKQRGVAESNSGMTVLNNLAIAYLDLNRPAQAVDTLQAALRLGAQLNLSDSLHSGATHANMALAYIQMDRPARAEPHLASALAIVELRCGKESSRTAGVLTAYSAVLRQLGRKSEAKAAEQRAKKIFEVSGVAAFAGGTVDIADLLRRSRGR